MEKTHKFTFPIPREIVLNANVAKHYRVRGLCVKAIREMAEALSSATCSLRFTKYTVDVFVYAPSKRRIDPPNLYPTVKALVDGLTDSQIWEDDDHEHMQKMSFEYGGLSELPEIFIIELIVKGEVK